MRLFVAINLPDDVRREMHEATAALRASAPRVGWVAEAKLHLTVKFLGEQPAGMVDASASALRTVAMRHRPFDVELGGVGAFPSMRAPSVIWLGVSPEPRLELMHHDVELAFQELGCALEGRAFRPHVTLGRVRAGAARDEARTMAPAARLVQFHAEAPVRTLDLMESVLGPGGSRYHTRCSVELGSGVGAGNAGPPAPR